MRRLILAIFAITLFAGFHTAQAAPAVSYPSGWNLVAGPAGSTFPGATAVYSFPPGAADYIGRTSDTPASTGYGYWAYYPQGGSPNLAGNPSSCRTTIEAPAGRYFLAGNTSSSNTATINGAAMVYTYDPVAGTYAAARTLTPGQGAWVMPDAGGAVTIDAGRCLSVAASALP